MECLDLSLSATATGAIMRRNCTRVRIGGRLRPGSRGSGSSGRSRNSDSVSSSAGSSDEGETATGCIRTGDLSVANLCPENTTEMEENGFPRSASASSHSSSISNDSISGTHHQLLQPLTSALNHISANPNLYSRDSFPFTAHQQQQLVDYQRLLIQQQQTIDKRREQQNLRHHSDEDDSEDEDDRRQFFMGAKRRRSDGKNGESESKRRHLEGEEGDEDDEDDEEEGDGQESRCFDGQERRRLNEQEDERKPWDFSETSFRPEDFSNRDFHDDFHDNVKQDQLNSSLENHNSGSRTTESTTNSAQPDSVELCTLSSGNQYVKARKDISEGTRFGPYVGNWFTSDYSSVSSYELAMDRLSSEGSGMCNKVIAHVAYSRILYCSHELRESDLSSLIRVKRGKDDEDDMDSDVCFYCLVWTAENGHPNYFTKNFSYLMRNCVIFDDLEILVQSMDLFPQN
ncbi:hypothetical protein QAD02_016777 [Eretmocerus hayati]|uniref:Uncharacterized protein n=1 Tax=Eretmocerus hayati TaxID=131215 RepID=A0ACC2PC58_9HYME|nr:hypothetical protein QAD02_016777 [Eretmocerus hayati]